MADVQLEHGHLRIANALDEAITFASFTGTQTKIVRCLVRLTFGWRRHSVRIALPDIAERCNVAASGGFRRALESLIHEGVVVEIEKSFGRIPALYAINKDFENWGKLSVPARALEALYGERPLHDDARARVTLEGQASANDEEVRLPLQGEMTVPTGESDCPHEGSQAGAKSLFGETVQGRKDSERQERHVVDEAPPINEPELSALYIAIWANSAAGERWPTTTRTYTQGSATELAAVLRADGIEWPLVRASIYEQCRKLTEQPGSVNYFRPGIQKAWAIEVARRQRVASGEQPPPLNAPANPSVIRRVEHWSDRKAREEKESADRALAVARSGNVDQRRAKPDGPRWWARMLTEAKAAGVHPTLYAYDRMQESADKEVTRASA